MANNHSNGYTNLTPAESALSPLSGLLKENEVAAMLNVSVSTLRRWRMLKKGPMFHKLPGSTLVRYNTADVQAYAREGLSEQTPF